MRGWGSQGEGGVRGVSQGEGGMRGVSQGEGGVRVCEGMGESG